MLKLKQQKSLQNQQLKDGYKLQNVRESILTENDNLFRYMEYCVNPIYIFLLQKSFGYTYK